MTIAEPANPSEEIEHLHARLSRLADEKSSLQLVVRLIEQLNPLPGIDDMVRAMLNSIVETIGGTDIKLYYWTEGELHYSAFIGENRILAEIDDPLVNRVAETMEFIEESGDVDSALMLGEVAPGSWTWIFPLLVGKELIGVIKLENLHLSSTSLRNYLPIFFSHAALILSNEIRNDSRKKAEAGLAESEHMFRAITDTSPLAIYMSSGIEQRAGYINPTFTRLFGYTLDEVPSAAEWWPLAYPDEVYRRQVSEEWQRKVERAIGTHSTIEPMEVVVTCKDGSRKNISWGFVSIGQQNWAFGLDFTERRQAEEQLRKERDFAESVVNTAPTIILVVDAQGRIVRINPYMEKISGYTLAEVINKDWFSTFLPKRTRDKTRALFLKAVGNIQTAGNIDTIVTRSGEERIIEWYDQTIKNADGDTLGLLAIGQDITERKQAEEKISDLNRNLERRVTERTAQLETANKELETFSYSVSHDLRTPLRAIDGFSRILQEDYTDRLDAEGQRLLNVVRDNAGRMGQLIDDILKFSRTSRLEMNFSEIDMEGLAHSVIEELQPVGRTLQAEIEPLPACMGDHSMMHQVFVNLLSNAIKFSSSMEIATIRVGGYIEGDEAIYFVRDNGAGFDMQYADRLFGVFQRLHDTDEFEGTGIGLAIVKRIVTRHGGRVWAEGKVNEGATIYFALPAILKNRG